MDPILTYSVLTIAIVAVLRFLLSFTGYYRGPRP